MPRPRSLYLLACALAVGCDSSQTSPISPSTEAVVVVPNPFAGIAVFVREDIGQWWTPGGEPFQATVGSTDDLQSVIIIPDSIDPLGRSTIVFVDEEGREVPPSDSPEADAAHRVVEIVKHPEHDQIFVLIVPPSRLAEARDGVERVIQDRARAPR